MLSPHPLATEAVAIAYSLQIFRQADKRHSKALSLDQWALVNSIVDQHPAPRGFLKQGSGASLAQPTEPTSRGKASTRRTRATETDLPIESASGFPSAWSFDTNHIASAKALVKESFTKLENEVASTNFTSETGQTITRPPSEPEQATGATSEPFFTHSSPHRSIPCSFPDPPQATQSEKQEHTSPPPLDETAVHQSPQIAPTEPSPTPTFLTESKPSSLEISGPIALTTSRPIATTKRAAISRLSRTRPSAHRKALSLELGNRSHQTMEAEAPKSKQETPPATQAILDSELSQPDPLSGLKLTTTQRHTLEQILNEARARAHEEGRREMKDRLMEAGRIGRETKAGLRVKREAQDPPIASDLPVEERRTSDEQRKSRRRSTPNEPQPTQPRNISQDDDRSRSRHRDHRHRSKNYESSRTPSRHRRCGDRHRDPSHDRHRKRSRSRHRQHRHDREDDREHTRYRRTSRRSPSRNRSRRSHREQRRPRYDDRSVSRSPSQHRCSRSEYHKRSQDDDHAPSRHRSNKSNSCHHRDPSSSRSRSRADISKSLRFKADEIALFDPYLDEKEYGSAPVVDRNGKIYCRSVHAFTEAIHNATYATDPRVIRTHLHLCLRGIAQAWYLSQLTESQRDRLRGGHGVERWTKALLDKWRQPPRAAWTAINAAHYGPEEIKAGKQPAEFVLSLCQSLKDAGVTDEESQLGQIWSRLDDRLQEVIDEPDIGSTIEGFIRKLEEKQYTWKRKFDRLSKFNLQAYQSTRRQVSPTRTSPFNNGKPSNGQPGNSRWTTNQRQPPQPSFQSRSSQQTTNSSTGNGPKPITPAPSKPSFQRPSNEKKSTHAYHEGESDSLDSPEQLETDNHEFERPELADEPEQHHEDQEIFDGWAGLVDQLPPSPLELIKPTMRCARPVPNASLQPIQPQGMKPSQCRICKADFPSRSKLHKHLKTQHSSAIQTHRNLDVDSFWTDVNEDDVPIIKSKAPPLSEPGHGFRTWHYMTISVRLSLQGDDIIVCLDTGCSSSLIKKELLYLMRPNAVIRKLPTQEWVRGIGDQRIPSSECVTIEIFIRAVAKGRPVMLRMEHEFRIVEFLPPGILIGMDIIGPEDILIDTPGRRAIIGMCDNAEIQISIRPRSSEPINATVRAKESITIDPATCKWIPIQISKQLASSGDYSFTPQVSKEQSSFRANGGSIYGHTIDRNTKAILARNDGPKPIQVHRHMPLGRVTECDIQGCYLVDQENHGLATLSPQKKSQPNLTIERQPDNETILDCGVTVFGDDQTVKAIAEVVNRYPNLWKDKGGTVKIPEDRYMTVPLKEGWQSANLCHKPYALSPKDKAVVDHKFNKLTNDGKLAKTTNLTPFAFPVFVVWKTSFDDKGRPTRKPRAVIDIRGLNHWTIKDSYPLPAQGDIINSLRGCCYISVVDAVAFFFQWMVTQPDQHHFTVNSHRGQETFRVALMGFKNSAAYVQRQLDIMLADLPAVKAYIDDMVCGSVTLQDHLNHLDRFFERLDSYGISLAPEKSFLGYPTVKLLGQRVDAFGISTAEDKIEAIRELEFPMDGNLLERYIGMAGYLRMYVPYFAKLNEPLESLRTAIFKEAPVKGAKRSSYGARAKIPDDPALREAFKHIQSHLSDPQRLIHHDSSRPSYLDVDASFERGFGACFYHVIDDPEPLMEDFKQATSTLPPEQAEHQLTTQKWLKRALYFPIAKVQPICFLSKRLTDAETRYGPTELEMAGLVWAVRKLRHMIEAAKKTYVFTDHSAVTALARQIHLGNSVSTDRLNLRLASASAYLAQYELDVRYRPGPTHFVPDALSRLPSTSSTFELPSASTLDDIDGLHANITNAQECDTDEDEFFCFSTTLVQLSDDFKQRIAQEYPKDSFWSKVLRVIERNRSDNIDPPLTQQETNLNHGLRFFEDNGLLFFIDQLDNRERLCIPTTMEKEVIALAHDNSHHCGYKRTYDRLATSVYMRHMRKRIQQYVAHCPDCSVNRTANHQPHGELNPILTPPTVYHTQASDFIVKLPPTSDGFDTLMTSTCKYSKEVLLTPGKETWTAEEWASVWLENLIDHEWNLPAAWISDRDPRFLSKFWQAVFEQLGTKMLTATAYHPQTDSQSERTNQTVEVAMRYFVTANDHREWTDALPYIKSVINNSPNAATGLAPMEIVRGFKSNHDTLNFLNELPPKDFADLRQQYRKMADEAMAFANVTAKDRYDSKHKPIRFKAGDQAFLRLHHGYEVLGHANRKLSNQRTGPFTIKRKVGNLAYELDLPPRIKIHPVVSVSQLEPKQPGDDPFNRTAYTEPPPVEGDSYEVEAILAKRVNRSTKKTQYLVKWLGYGPTHNAWYDADDLRQAKDLVDEFNERTQNYPEAIPRRPLRKPSQAIRRSIAQKPPPTEDSSQNPIPKPIPSEAALREKSDSNRVLRPRSKPTRRNPASEPPHSTSPSS